VALGTAALLFGFLLLVGHTRAVHADPGAVGIMNVAFSPNAITINAGDSVTWTNNESDGTPHTVTADDQSWDSGIMSPGGSYTVTFSAPGDFTFHCNVHLSMTGVVHVAGG
jgi:plastocyanin